MEPEFPVYCHFEELCDASYEVREEMRFIVVLYIVFVDMYVTIHMYDCMNPS